MKTISRILILTMVHLCWLTSYGWAEILPTESAVQSQSQTQTDRQRILNLLNLQEVVDELEKFGISKGEAVARFNSLTDEEVSMIAGKLDELPAGAEFNVMCIFLPAAIIYELIALIIVGPFFLIYKMFGGEMEAGFKTPGILKMCGINYSNDTYEEGDVSEDCDPGMESCT